MKISSSAPVQLIGACMLICEVITAQQRNTLCVAEKCIMPPISLAIGKGIFSHTNGNIMKPNQSWTIEFSLRNYEVSIGLQSLLFLCFFLTML